MNEQKVVRSRFYRIFVAPLTLYLFARYFYLSDEPAWITHAIRYTWRTL